MCQDIVRVVAQDSKPLYRATPRPPLFSPDPRCIRPPETYKPQSFHQISPLVYHLVCASLLIIG